MKPAHLQAVAHDIAHHARSGLSPLAFTLYRACREVEVLSVTLDLMSSGGYPGELPVHEDLARSLDALRATFRRMLADRGFEPAIVEAARLHVEFPAMETDGSLFATYAVIEAAGRRFERGFPLPDPATLSWLHREAHRAVSDRVSTREEVLEEMRLHEPFLADILEKQMHDE